jgi:GT2 family glycosyltransferase
VTGEPWLTVGIPTRDRPTELAQLLALLAEQLPELRARWRLQVLVADGSDTPAVLPAQLAAAADDAAVVGVRGGVSTGRNVLAAHARGEVLVLVDDDVRPRPGALAALADAVRPGTAVAGRVEGLGHRPGEASALMAVGRAGFGVPVPLGGEPDYAVSALLALPRDVYERVAWDERFAAAHLDDVMYGLRLRAAGVELVECPAATADHPPRGDRPDKDRPELARQRALVVLTRWAQDRPARAWLRCLAHVAWSHRRRPRDLAAALAGYLDGTRSWVVAR